MIAASVDHLADAVELALTAHAPATVLVFDHHPEIDDHRDAVTAAAARLAAAGGAISLDTLADLLDRGRELPAPRSPRPRTPTRSRC